MAVDGTKWQFERLQKTIERWYEIICWLQYNHNSIEWLRIVELYHINVYEAVGDCIVNLWAGMSGVIEAKIRSKSILWCDFKNYLKIKLNF